MSERPSSPPWTDCIFSYLSSLWQSGVDMSAPIHPVATLLGRQPNKTHAFASPTLREPFLTLVNSRMSSKRNRCMSSAFDISIRHTRAHRSHMIAINRHRARSVTMDVNHGGRGTYPQNLYWGGRQWCSSPRIQHIIMYLATWYAVYLHLFAQGIMYYIVSQKKGATLTMAITFVNSWSICKLLSLLQRVVNLQQNQYNVTHHTLSMLLYYVGKLKNQKFALCMQVRRLKCDFLSPTQQISVKCHVNKCKD